jgi:hypothetical protein
MCCLSVEPPYFIPMINDVAKRLDSPLRPEDLAALQSVLARVCELKGDSQTSEQAEKHARLLINLYQSGIRNRHQLIAMLTGKRFP